MEDDDSAVVFEAGESDGVDVCEFAAQDCDGVLGVVELLRYVAFFVSGHDAAGLAEGKGKFGEDGEGGEAAGEGNVEGLPDVGVVGEGLGAILGEVVRRGG